MLTWGTVNSLNILRVAICLIILGYSCVTDWKTRRAPNRLWYLMGALGLAIGLFELYGRGFDYYYALSWGVSFVFIFIMMYFLYYFFQYFGMTGIGGADAKAIIAIAILFPYYPHLILGSIALPIMDVTRSIIFAFSVFGNALALNLVVPVAILAYNLFTVPLKELLANPLGAFTGYKVNVEGVKGRYLRLMHRYVAENGQLKVKKAFGGIEIDDDMSKNLKKWKSEGKIGEKIWVTPKIPFLIPITLGFLTAIAYGDILMQILGLVILR